MLRSRGKPNNRALPPSVGREIKATQLVLYLFNHVVVTEISAIDDHLFRRADGSEQRGGVIVGRMGFSIQCSSGFQFEELSSPSTSSGTNLEQSTASLGDVLETFSWRDEHNDFEKDERTQVEQSCHLGTSESHLLETGIYLREPCLIGGPKGVVFEV